MDCVPDAVRIGGGGRAGRLGAVALALALAAPARAADTSLATGVATGAGWDSNLSGAQGNVPLASAGYVTANAYGGVLLALEDDDLSLELGYDGERYRQLYSGLDLDRGALTVAWVHAFGKAVTFRVAPSAGLRSYGDPARNGWDAGALATLRLGLGDATALRIGGGWRHREADDPAYAWESFRGRAGIERDLWEGAFVALTYSIDVGSDTFYAPTTTATTTPLAAAPQGVLAVGPGSGTGSGSGTGGGMGPGGSYGSLTGTFGTPLVAYSASRVASTYAADLAHHWKSGIFLELGYAYTRVDGQYQSYDAHLATGALGWRH